MEDFFIHENVPGLNSISDELDSRLDIVMKLFIMLYEDDTVLMAESSSNLQTLLDKFYLYCDTWKMKVNVDKTKIVVFFLKNDYQEILFFNYNGINIEIAKEFNYLGIYFSRTGSFKVCKNHLSEKAIKAMYEVILQNYSSLKSYNSKLYDIWGTWSLFFRYRH